MCGRHVDNVTLPELKKDPGIPNLWPFKDKLLQQIEDAKQRVRAAPPSRPHARPARSHATHTPFVIVCRFRVLGLLEN